MLVTLDETALIKLFALNCAPEVLVSHIHFFLLTPMFSSNVIISESKVLTVLKAKCSFESEIKLVIPVKTELRNGSLRNWTIGIHLMNTYSD